MKIVRGIPTIVERYEVEPAFFIEYKEKKKIYLVYDRLRETSIERCGVKIRMPRCAFQSKNKPYEVQEFFTDHGVSESAWRLCHSRIISAEEAKFYLSIKLSYNGGEMSSLET